MSKASSKVDLSKYCESYNDEEDDYSVALDLPKDGLVRHNSSDSSRKLTGSDFDDFEKNSDELYFSSESADCRLQDPTSVKINDFFSNYKGPGKVMRLSGSKKNVNVEHNDWCEDIIIPTSGLPSLKTDSKFEENNSFFTAEVSSQNPPSVSDHLSSISLLEESLEEDFQFPEQGFDFRLSSPLADVPLELNVDEDKYPDPIPSEASPVSQKRLSSYIQDDSGENWDDIVIPKHITKLNVTPRKPYRTANKEENWLEDLEIPSDNIFTLKIEQNRLLKRKPISPPRTTKRSTLRLDVFPLPDPTQSSFYRPYACRALRQKKSGDSFLRRQATLKESPLTFSSKPVSNYSKFTSSSSIFYQPKLRLYGDGTELDDFDNLPVPITSKVRHKNKIQRLNPPKENTTQPEEKFSSFLNQFSEIEVKRDCAASKTKPHLIRNLNSLKVERTVNGMKFNPQTQCWEGNEEVLKVFEPSSPPRPALITNLNGNKRSQRVGDMVFDPVEMRWFSIAQEEDPLADIPDLIPNDPVSAGTRPGFAPGDSFHLSPTYIDSLYSAERQHRQFMSNWASGSSVDSRGVGFDHLFDIHNFASEM